MAAKSRGRGGSTDVLALLEAAQTILAAEQEAPPKGRLSMQAEIRTLEFWRAIIAECIATFFYVLMLSSVHQALNHPKDSIATVQLYSAITAGLAAATLTHAFLKVSGAHMNPALTVSCVLVKRISILRGAMYICAQCGGAIAGAALVYGVYGKYGAKDQFGSPSLANFGMEFIMTVLVVYVYFSATDPNRRRKADAGSGLDPAMTIGLAYMATLSAYRGALNPARALGPCFVADSFDFHWVFWVGPILGAVCGACCHQFIFNLHRSRWSVGKECDGGVNDGDAEDSGSVKSDDDMLDDLERVRRYKSNILQTYHEGTSSVYNTAVKPFKRPPAAGADSVYGGTKSLYNGHILYDGRRTPGLDCSRSLYGGDEPVPRSHQERTSAVSLKRSQSVHSKVPQRRSPQDKLPDEPQVGCRAAEVGGCRSTSGTGNRAHQQQQLHHRQASQAGENSEAVNGGIYSSEAAYREYIRQKNAAADQCSGSSSGYYSSYRGDNVDQPPPDPHRRQHSLSAGSTKGVGDMMARRGGGQEEGAAEFRPIDNGRTYGSSGAGHRLGNFTPSSHSSYHSGY